MQCPLQPRNDHAEEFEHEQCAQHRAGKDEDGLPTDEQAQDDNQDGKRPGEDSPQGRAVRRQDKHVAPQVLDTLVGNHRNEQQNQRQFAVRVDVEGEDGSDRRQQGGRQKVPVAAMMRPA